MMVQSKNPVIWQEISHGVRICLHRSCRHDTKDFSRFLRNTSIVFFQKFGTIRADLIEQMRFKQRLKVIQTLEDTTKRNVVSLLRNGMWPSVPILPCIPTDSNSCLTD